MSESDQLLIALKQLAFRIKKEVEGILSSGTVQPLEEKYNLLEADLKYTEKGPQSYFMIGREFIRKNWHLASHEILASIKKSEEYSHISELINKILGGNDKINYKFWQLRRRLILGYLYEEANFDEEVVSIITSFMSDINEEPINVRLLVEIDGVIVLSSEIEIKIGDMKIIVRQTSKEDLEKEMLESEFRHPSLLEVPSAILNIEFLGRPDEVQRKLLLAIEILRLFKVGSIKFKGYYQYSWDSDPVFPAFYPNLESERVLEKYLITEEDAQKLKKFWHIIIELLPLTIYKNGEKQPNYITMAYERYCDALLQDGVYERRIANAVMGLESLFLKKSGETQELSYRLVIRIAKLFSLLGLDSYKVREVLKIGYGIRSSFVHGGYPSPKEKTKLNEKYGDIRNFLSLLLDYLRISIITMIMIKEEKDEFLDMIEDSIIDKDIDNHLNNILNKMRDLI